MYEELNLLNLTTNYSAGTDLLISNNNTNSTFENTEETGAADGYLKLVLNGILGSIVGSIGLVGNVFVLSKYYMQVKKHKKKADANKKNKNFDQRPFYIFLIALAIIDSFMIVTYFLVIAIPSILSYYQKFISYQETTQQFLYLIMYPLSNIFKISSIYLKLAVTYVEYYNIRKPLGLRFNCKTSKLCAISIFLIAVVYCIPKWFEIELVPVSKPYDANNSTYSSAEYSSLVENEYYIQIYLMGLNLLVVSAIPFLSLGYFSLNMHYNIRRSVVKMAAFRTTSREKQKNIMMKRAIRLLTLVLVFYVFNILDAVNNIIFCLLGRMKIQWLMELGTFSILVNSSVNFVIYFSAKKKCYRRVLCLLCLSSSPLNNNNSTLTEQQEIENGSKKKLLTTSESEF